MKNKIVEAIIKTYKLNVKTALDVRNVTTRVLITEEGKKKYRNVDFCFKCYNRKAKSVNNLVKLSSRAKKTSREGYSIRIFYDRFIIHHCCVCEVPIKLTAKNFTDISIDSVTSCKYIKALCLKPKLFYKDKIVLRLFVEAAIAFYDMYYSGYIDKDRHIRDKLLKLTFKNLPLSLL